MIQQRVVKSVWPTVNGRVMEVFLEPALLFSGQNKYTNTRRCLTIFRQKTRVSRLQKYQKYTFSSAMAIKMSQSIFNKSLIDALFTKNTQI